MNEIIRLGGRPVAGFGVGGLFERSDPCAAWPFQGLLGYSTELPVLKAEDEQADRYVSSLNAAITATCPSMRDVDKVGWMAVYQKWQTLHKAIQEFLSSWLESNVFFATTHGYKTTAAEYMCRIEAIRRQVDDYQKKANTQCDPKNVPSAPPPPEPPYKDKEVSSEQLLSTLKTVVVAVAATAGVIYLVPLVGRLIPEKT
jgi:hypothetical protein